MNIHEIKQKLKSNEYDFLRNNKKLNNNICLLTLGGSYAYGTNNLDSDIDIRGIYLPSKEDILSMNYDNKPFENHDTDTVIYPLKQIFKLLCNSNPNTIEILGTLDEQLFVCNEYGKLIRDNVDLFLSKRAADSFSGYATSQFHRLYNALYHSDNDKKEQHIMESIQKRMLTFNDRYSQTKKDNINIYIDDSKKENLNKEIFVDLNFNHYPLRDFRGLLSEMRETINDYNKIDHRNNKKDRKHLFKHAMHLIRLFLMGIDILSGNGIKTYREKDKQLLLDIRNEKYSFDEIFELYNKYQKEFKYVEKNTLLPDKPDYKKINDLIIYINSKILTQ